MSAFAPPTVLLLAGRADDERRWTERLRPLARAVWRSSAEIPGEVPEVVVTDLDAAAASKRAGFSFDRSASAACPAVGVVTVGAATWGDASLAADASDREWALVCPLVGEIARLRRQKDHAERTRRVATQLAETDPLTGVANRRAWEARLQPWLARGATEPPSWLAVLDLDGFKQVNDRHGMARGDQVLVGAARALQEQLRGGDVLARLGGDEFGILLANVHADQVAGVFARLQRAVAEQTAREGVAVSASVGYVSLGDGATGGQLMAAAEQAMRKAKSRPPGTIARSDA